MMTWKMLAKNATAPIGIMIGVTEKGSVAGVVLRVFAVGEVFKAMDAMVILEEKICMHVY